MIEVGGKEFQTVNDVSDAGVLDLDAVEHVHAKYTEKDALLNDIGENQITSTSPRTYLDEFIVRSTKYRKIIPDADKLSLIQYLLIEEQDWGK